MRAAALTLEDVLAGARALGRIDAAGAGPAALAAATQQLLTRRVLAECYRRAHGRAHPRLGDGTLASAAARLTDGLGTAPQCASTLRGAAALCAALANVVEDAAVESQAAAS